ncbi:MAG: HlyD family efflux transporter periplasmic adaptor subunit [Pirellulaceae bacterium]
MTETADIPRLQSVALPALKLVQSTVWIRKLGYGLLISMVIAGIAMLALPWQQAVRGKGRVIAFVPQERQQPVTSPVKGVVATVAPDLREGDLVKQGDVILELQPVAANMVEQISFQLNDLKSKLETSKIKQEVYLRNVRDYTDARDYAVKAAQEMVQMAEAKLSSKQEMVVGYRAKELQARQNYDRQKSLFDKGATAEKELEKLKKDLDVAIAELASAEFGVKSAEKEVEAKRNELEQKRSEAETKIDYARAMEQDALGMQASVQKEIRDLEIKQSEFKQFKITAPRNGTIYRLPVFERGQTIKEGEYLFTIVPESSERAVELFVDGNDIALIHVDDHVRLQFEGWPAIQFSGWPSVAVGTFGGKVAKIDPTDDGMGEFRIQVIPEHDNDWPPNQYLRQGVRANGWVMLKQVTLGYEIWRQLNGFPPVISKEPNKDAKPEKVPLPK